MHTVWKGSISFGLVNIPVKLHSAVEDKDIKFRQLHKECLTPIKYKKVSECDDDVTSDEIIKVYETPNGKFIEITDEEIKRLKEEFEIKTVNIIDFVKLNEIDPIYFDKSYYISADTGGGKPYALLSQILKKSKKIGIAKITIRSKESLAVIRPYKDRQLILETIHYPSEVRDASNIPIGTIDTVSEKEFEIGMLLVDQLTTKFEPGKYTDTYRTALENLIEEKIKNNDYITTEESNKSHENVVDLMAALEASINKTKKMEKEKKTKTKTKKKSS